jgi:TatD DNase family protein
MFHCFTGDLAALKVIMDAGYYVSFSGIITFKNSSLADCVRYAPLERTLIETDSPYLAPAPHRGETNRPDWVVIVGKKLAEIKNADVEAIAAAMTRNFHDLFGIEA